MGTKPSSAPTMCTARHSRPLAPWKVTSSTPSPPMVSSASCTSQARKPGGVGPRQLAVLVGVGQELHQGVVAAATVVGGGVEGSVGIAAAGVGQGGEAPDGIGEGGPAAR